METSDLQTFYLNAFQCLKTSFYLAINVFCLTPFICLNVTQQSDRTNFGGLQKDLSYNSISTFRSRDISIIYLCSIV